MIDPSLKVLFCAFQVVPEPSGASARTTEFLRALQGVCTVDALTAKSPDVGHIERYLGARLMRVPVGAGDLAARSQAFERAVRRQLDSDEYQIIHVSDPFAGSALLDLKAKHRFKLVYDAATFPSFDLRYTDPHLEGDRSFMAKLKRDELLCLMGADAVVTPSPVMQEHIAKLGVPKQRITVIPPAVDLKPFAQFAGARPDRIPMRLLYMGSQVAWQGLPTLLFAMKDALKQPAAGGVRLSILGPRHPDWRDQLEEQVKASGLAGNVEFLEPVSRDDLPRVIAQHDVGVAPLEKSDRNVQSGGAVMKLAEYAAAGRAIVCSDLPVTRAMVDEKAALFFTPSRESALSAAIVALAKDPLKRVQMGQAARALGTERFDTARAAVQLLGVYEGLGAKAPGGKSRSEEVDIPTSVGADPMAHDEPTGSTREPRTGPADVTTGKFSVPDSGELRLPPEPTPVVPGVVAGLQPPPEPKPSRAETVGAPRRTNPPTLVAEPARAAPQPPPMLEPATPAPPTEAVPALPPPPLFGDELPHAEDRASLFGTPALFSEEEQHPASSELPVLQGQVSTSTLLGELLPDVPRASIPLPEDEPLAAPPRSEVSLPAELFGLPPDPVAQPEPVAAPKPTSPPMAARLPPPVLGGGGPPMLSPSGPPVLSRPPGATPRPAPAQSRPPSVGAPPVIRPPSAGAPVLAPARPAQAPRPPSTGAPQAPPVLAAPPPPAPVAPQVASPPPLAAAPPPIAPPPIAVAPPKAITPAPIAPPPIAVAPPKAITPPPIAPPITPAPITPPPIAKASAPAPAPTPAPTPALAAPGKPKPASGVVELSDSDFASVDEPDLVEADAVEALEPPAQAKLQNSLDLGSPDPWFNSLILGFAPLGQLGAAPVRGSPLSSAQPLKI